MEFVDFLREMLGITEDFAITKIEKDETGKIIRIHMKYLYSNFKGHKLYDCAPERVWQHLNWFDYSCYLVCSLPRYLAEDGKPKTIYINFCPEIKGLHAFICPKNHRSVAGNQGSINGCETVQHHAPHRPQRFPPLPSPHLQR